MNRSHEQLPSLWPQIWLRHLEQGMQDDHFEWDFSAWATQRGRGQLETRVIAKANGVWVGAGACVAVEKLAEQSGKSLSVNCLRRDGASVKAGDEICRWKGEASILLALERPFLNLVGYASGIATRTRGFVDRVTRACPKRTPRVTSTRKTLPGYRDLVVSAVVAGGGFAHRLGLDSGVLIKENHLEAGGGIKAVVERARKQSPHLLKIEVEVKSLQELKEACVAGVDVVMLDNFSPAQVRKGLELLDEFSLRPLVEVSGGLNEATIVDYSIPGVDILSVGGLTHTVTNLDLSMLEKSLRWKR